MRLPAVRGTCVVPAAECVCSRKEDQCDVRHKRTSRAVGASSRRPLRAEGCGRVNNVRRRANCPRIVVSSLDQRCFASVGACSGRPTPRHAWPRDAQEIDSVANWRVSRNWAPCRITAPRAEDGFGRRARLTGHRRVHISRTPGRRPVRANTATTRRGCLSDRQSSAKNWASALGFVQVRQTRRGSWRALFLGRCRGRLRSNVMPVSSEPNGAGDGRTRVVDYIVEHLARRGIRHVFGVDGANIEDLYDAAYSRPDVTAVVAKHEFSAAAMADAYSRAGGGIGIVAATSGGGALNTIPGLGESFASRVPVLALIGQPPATTDGRGSFQDTSGRGGALDGDALFSAVSVFCRRVLTPADDRDRVAPGAGCRDGPRRPRGVVAAQEYSAGSHRGSGGRGHPRARRVGSRTSAPWSSCSAASTAR